jgi:predicted phage-related endonuclease
MEDNMTPNAGYINIQPDLIQGSEEWLQARIGLLTASEMKLIISPKKLQAANNDKSRAHLYELLAQRISGHIEPHYLGDDMLRGREEEILAREVYEEEYGPVSQVGFITNSKWGFTIGYSPDWLVGDDGQAEAKSRRQKFQVETILADEVPEEFVIQVQTGLLVTERKWCDFVSYCGGMPMLTKRVYPDARIQEAILEAAAAFEEEIRVRRFEYEGRLVSSADRLIATERFIEQEITI